MQFLLLKYLIHRARICKRLRSPGTDSEESIPPAYVAWRVSTANRVVVPARQAGNRFLGSLKGLQIRAQYRSHLLFAECQSRGKLYFPKPEFTNLSGTQESIPRNRFRQPMKHTTNRFIAPARQVIEASGIDSLESNPGLLKSLQIRALDSFFFSSRR
jgi:hypothetical protein